MFTNTGEKALKLRLHNTPSYKKFVFSLAFVNIYWTAKLVEYRNMFYDCKAYKRCRKCLAYFRDYTVDDIYWLSVLGPLFLLINVIKPEILMSAVIKVK